MAENELTPYENIEQAALAGSVSDVFRVISTQTPEIVAGLLMNRRPMIGKGIRLLLAGFKGAFLVELSRLVEEARKRGSIKDAYLASDPAKACFADLLDFVDKTSPDPKRFEAIRNVFLRILRQGETGTSAPYRQQMLRIVCDLSAGELVVLAAVYKLGTGANKNPESWRHEVANASGLLRAELVAGIEDGLVAKRLLLPLVSTPNEFSGETTEVAWGIRNRLTLLGQEVCEQVQVVSV